MHPFYRSDSSTVEQRKQRHVAYPLPGLTAFYLAPSGTLATSLQTATLAVERGRV